jgi:hypothetical protein
MSERPRKQFNKRQQSCAIPTEDSRSPTDEFWDFTRSTWPEGSMLL